MHAHQLRLFSMQTSQTLILLHILFAAGSENELSDILHDHFFFILARFIKLAMSLVDVVLDLGELLDGPLAHIDQSFHFFTGCRIQSGQSAV